MKTLIAIALTATFALIFVGAEGAAAWSESEVEREARWSAERWHNYSVCEMTHRDTKSWCTAEKCAALTDKQQANEGALFRLCCLRENWERRMTCREIYYPEAL